MNICDNCKEEKEDAFIFEDWESDIYHFCCKRCLAEFYYSKGQHDGN